MSTCATCGEREEKYRWHTGSVMTYPYCESCLEDELSSRNLSRYDKHKYENDGPEAFVSGYVTPNDSTFKIVKLQDLREYQDLERKTGADNE